MAKTRPERSVHVSRWSGAEPDAKKFTCPGCKKPVSHGTGRVYVYFLGATLFEGEDQIPLCVPCWEALAHDFADEVMRVQITEDAIRRAGRA